MMGAAEVVPGVSGGTIAFVSGLYDRLVHAIQRFSPASLFQLRKVGLLKMWTLLDINFLMMLFGSMLVSVLILARGVSYMLEFHPVPIWSFFFGLVIASVYAVGKNLKPFNLDTGLAILAGVAVGLFVTRLAPLEASASPLFLFAGGCVAVCAWILPGLSGSFILLILGLYQTVITAIKDFELLTLSYVGAGCVVGIVSFSRLLSILLDRYHKLTVATLMGFMLGSLNKIWPWQRTVSYQIKDDGSQFPVAQEPVLPETYYQLTGMDPMLIAALVAALAGFLLIMALDRFALLTESEPEWYEDKS